ncbi:hypothetical protein BAE44_0002357 [Dichanthelium oligosanthes]|uniref:DUF4378 domain-containing protein n=1 Tax=Dichanthelium oligosanthes TaxID=888268 RepID=A0A1E5WH02_9POAL|nr:hypothetical protein BAE44_0002357 [Dichanthelium oligosanthes]
MDDVELEGRPRQPLMLKEWLELESSAELSRDGFGCYPRHLPAELRSASGRRRRNGGDVIARFSAAVRAALSRPPPAGREGEAAALSRSLSRRLRVGFWKKRSGEAEETERTVARCSATATSSGRRDAPSSSPAMSPRRMSWEGRQAGGDGAAGLSGGRRSHETVVAGCECEATCQLDEEREQEQRLSPVSVMDFPSQDGDDGNDDDRNDHSCGDGHIEDDDASPTFEQSLANIRRASQQLLERIRRFEQLAEVDTSDVDDATTTTAEDATSCLVEELDSIGDGEDDAEGARGLPGLTEATSPSPCAAAPCFRRLLQDFFREGLSSSCHDGVVPDDPDVERSLLDTAKAWLDGRQCRALGPDGKAEVEEIERLGRWRWFREDEQELLGSDVEGGIFWSLMEELVDDLC